MTLTPLEMFVSHGRPLENGSTTSNTRVLQMQGHRIGGTVLSTSIHRSDAVACGTASGNGFNFGAASMHGGYSIAWCPGCGGLDGTVESITWGLRADGDSRCF